MPQLPPLLKLAACLRRSYATRARLEHFRNVHLRKLIAHAASRVPFYQKHWANAGINAMAVESVADLSRIPTVERTVFRATPAEELLARGIPSSELVGHHTGGTGGTAFEMIHRISEIRTLRWFMFRVFHEHGRSRLDLLSRIWRGRKLPRRPRFSRAILNRLGWYLRSDLKWPQDPNALADDMLRVRPTFVEAPPVALMRAAARLGPSGIETLGVKTLFCEGEWLSGPARRWIEKTWRAPVAELYGSTEFYVMAWTCADCGQLHTCDDSVIVEVLREDGQPATPGERGEIVATALHGFAMPLIRIKTGDLVIQGDPVAPCGRPFGSIARILGRASDMIPLAGASPLHPSDMDSVFADASWVREFQLIASSTTRVEVSVIATRPVSEAERLNVERRFQERLGSGVRGTVKLVDDIPLGADEKFRLVVRG